MPIGIASWPADASAARGASLVGNRLLLQPAVATGLIQAGITDAHEFILQAMTNPSWIAAVTHTSAEEVARIVASLREEFRGTEVEELYSEHDHPDVAYGAMPPLPN